MLKTKEIERELTAPKMNTEQSVPVMEHFYTLQGEGFWTGTPTYFIRLSGCDVGCVWCDVKASWQTSADQSMDISKLVETVLASGTHRVVITGGEPFTYDLTHLTSALKAAGLLIHVETAGVYPITGSFDWICHSPKKFKPSIPEYYDRSHELKVVIYNKHDLVWAEQEAAKCNPANTLFFLQPEWSKRSQMSQLIIEYVKNHPHWRLSMQTHKYLDIP